MSIRRPTVLAAAAGLAVAMPAAAQPTADHWWNSPSGGNWNTPANWDTGEVPSGPNAHAHFSVESDYFVTLDVPTMTLLSAYISDTGCTLVLNGNTINFNLSFSTHGKILSANGSSSITGKVLIKPPAVVDITPGTSLSLSPNVFNGGTIFVNYGGVGVDGPTASLIVPAGAVTYYGSGSISMNGAGDKAQIAGPGTLRNTAWHTIRGQGQILAALENEALVEADSSLGPLHLMGAQKNNTGTFRAAPGSTLAISGTTVGGNGVIVADDGQVTLSSATIVDGQFQTSELGVVRTVKGTVTLTNVHNTGRFNVEPNSGVSLSGAFFLNDGEVIVNPLGNNTSPAVIHALESVMLNGDGYIRLNGAEDAARITAAHGATISNRSSHAIYGRGRIHAPVINDGEIVADESNMTLSLLTSPKTNYGLIAAVDDGILSIDGITVTQPAAGVILADAGVVDLKSATIGGGEIRAANGGLIRSVTGTQTLLNTKLNGNLWVLPSTTLALQGPLMNNGSILVNPQSNHSLAAILHAKGPVTISGSGQIVLSANAAAAQITASPDGSLTLGENQIIRGNGQISAPLINNGLVRANVLGRTLSLLSTPKVNNTLMVASSNSTLAINGATVTQAPNADIVADGGTVALTNATIVGGWLASTEGGRVRSVAGTQTLDNVTLDGFLDIEAGTTVNLAPGAFVNEGIVRLNQAGNASLPTALNALGDVAIDGSGLIHLGAPDTAAAITGDGTITLGSDQRITGRGLISARLINNGDIAAEGAGQAITLTGPNKVNNGSMVAGPVSALAIISTTVNQSPSGTIFADDGVIDLTDAGIGGGTITAKGGGRVRAIAGTQTLSAMLLDAPLEINADSTVTLVGTIENNETITVNTTADDSSIAILGMSGPVSITGSGEILLNADLGASQIAGSSVDLGPDQTLRGVGTIACPLTLHGTIAPGRSVGTIAVLDPSTPITYKPGSTLAVELGSSLSHDRIAGGSHVIDGGSVAITLVDGYTPALFDTHTIIDGSGASTVTGAFDTLIAPAPPEEGLLWKIGYTGQDVVVGLTCPTDVNVDFALDILDLLDFLNDFGACRNQPAPCGSTVNPDYNGDTLVDILDLLDFIDAFGSGC